MLSQTGPLLLRIEDTQPRSAIAKTAGSLPFVYGGILDFSGTEDRVLLPQWMVGALALSEKHRMHNP